MKSRKQQYLVLVVVLLVTLFVSACAPAAPTDTQIPSESTDSTTVTLTDPTQNATQPSSDPADPTGESTNPTESVPPTQVTVPSDATEPTQPSTTPSEPAVKPTDPPKPPSATEPPTQPAETQPPATQPPVTEPPATQPPETQPPVTEPPATQPPVPPAGTKEDPAALVIGSNSASVTGEDYYYYTWTAQKDGTLSLSFTSTVWAYEILNLTAGDELNQSSKNTDEIPNKYPKIQVFKGDQLLIAVNRSSATAGTVKFKASFSETLLGTETDPFIVNPESTVYIRVPAGKSVYFSSRAYSTTLTVGNASTANLVFEGKTYKPSKGKIEFVVRNAADSAESGQHLLFELVNNSSSVQIYSVTIVRPSGTWDKPANLTDANNSVSIAEGSTGYVYEWTATSAGTLTLTMQGDNWSYNMDCYNASNFVVTASVMGSSGAAAEEDRNPTPSIEYAAGQVIRITINTADGKAGTVEFTATFE